MQQLLAILLFLIVITGPIETVESQLMSRIRKDFSKKLEVLNHENDNSEEKYAINPASGIGYSQNLVLVIQKVWLGIFEGCVVDQCFPRLQTCMNGKFAIIEDAEERQFLEVHCVTEFGICATTCFNRYKTSPSI